MADLVIWKEDNGYKKLPTDGIDGIRLKSSYRYWAENIQNIHTQTICYFLIDNFIWISLLQMNLSVNWHITEMYHTDLSLFSYNKLLPTVKKKW